MFASTRPQTWGQPRLDTLRGRNFPMRIYRGDPTVLNGGYKLPPTVAVKMAA